jgi:alpha-beta hydrolase superfamily lysophospholipase
MPSRALPALALLLVSACGNTDECAIPDNALGSPTAWEQDWLDAGGAPESPAPAAILGEDGLALAHRDWVPVDWDGTGPALVLVPGSSSHSEAYAQLGAALSDNGVYTRIIDVRGHGLSVCRSATDCTDPTFTPRQPVDDSTYFPGRLGDAADPDQLARDLGAHLADLSARFPAASLHLAGHSSGGGLVSHYVENAGAHAVSSVSLLAPYNHPDQPQVRPEVQLDCPDLAGTAYARLDMGALGDALRGDLHRYVLTLHKGADLTQPLDTLAYTWATVQGMAASDPDGFWAAHTAPLLFVIADEDNILDPSISAEQAERAAGPVTVWVAEETSHVGLAWSAAVGQQVADHAWAGHGG